MSLTASPFGRQIGLVPANRSPCRLVNTGEEIESLGIAVLRVRRSGAARPAGQEELPGRLRPSTLIDGCTDFGLHQPDAVRTGMACCPATVCRMIAWPREPDNDGKVIRVSKVHLARGHAKTKGAGQDTPGRFWRATSSQSSALFRYRYFLKNWRMSATRSLPRSYAMKWPPDVRSVR